MRCVAIIALAALAVANPLNPQVEEGNKALAALKENNPDDADAVQMVSEDQRQDQGVGEILTALGQNSPDVRTPKTTQPQRLPPRNTPTNVGQYRMRKPRRALDVVMTMSLASSLPSKLRALR